MVGSLRDAGLSVRAVAAVTGDHYSTVSRAGVADATPKPKPEPRAVDQQAVTEHAQDTVEPDTEDDMPPETAVDRDTGEITQPAPRVTGVDGKSYPAAQSPRQAGRASRPPRVGSPAAVSGMIRSWLSF